MPEKLITPGEVVMNLDELRLRNVPTTSGIYLFGCKDTWMAYPGQARDFRRRYREHSSYLNQKKCSRKENIRFFNAWKKYGKENFVFCSS